MSELLQLAAALTRAAQAGQVSVLATVVRTEGSTYRRIGARMVVLADGSHVGAVSAGCLEADLVLRAAAVRESGRPEVVIYDTRSADDLIWGLGLGCGGMTELLLESLVPERAMAKAESLRRTAESRHRIVLATVIRTSGDAVKPGDQAMLDDRSILTGFDGLDSASRNIVQRGAREALESGFSVAVRHTLNRHEVDVAYEVVSPIVRLSVCGAGPDAAPLVAAANRLGWHVTLMDHRPALIAAEQWPEVDCILVQSPGEVAGAVAKVDSDAVIVMNHRYERDLEYLAAWIGTPVPYIGVLGPRHRTERMLDALQKKGLDIGSARERIRGPVGLDIGAETSEEIALAIVGEIQAVHAGRGGGFLRSHEGAIHGPLEGSRLEIPEWAPVR